MRSVFREVETVHFLAVYFDKGIGGGRCGSGLSARRFSNLADFLRIIQALVVVEGQDIGQER